MKSQTVQDAPCSTEILGLCSGTHHQITSTPTYANKCKNTLVRGNFHPFFYDIFTAMVQQNTAYQNTAQEPINYFNSKNVKISTRKRKGYSLHHERLTISDYGQIIGGQLTGLHIQGHYMIFFCL